MARLLGLRGEPNFLNGKQLPEVKDRMAQNIARAENTPKHHPGPQDQPQEGPSEFFSVVSRIRPKSCEIRSFARRLCVVHVHDGDSVAGSSGWVSFWLRTRSQVLCSKSSNSRSDKVRSIGRVSLAVDMECLP
jgi:hypothetical protein